MPEPMTPETNPQSEQLDLKKEEIFDQLRKQNEALQGIAFTFLKKADGSEYVLFNYSSVSDAGYYQGGFDGSGFLMPKVKADLLLKHKDKPWEDVSREYMSSMEEKPIRNDIDRDRWISSLKRSEEMAANSIKAKRAEEHYTPLLLAAIGDMPNVLAADGFDMHTEMRKNIASTSETSTEPNQADIQVPDAGEAFHPAAVLPLTDETSTSKETLKPTDTLDAEPADQSVGKSDITLVRPDYLE